MERRQPEEVVQAWRESAPFWQKHRETVRLMFAPMTDALVKEARITRGMNVLDVACGSGEPGLTLAEVVGSNGSVTCTDIISEMVAAAQQAAADRGLANMKFRQGAADALPFDENTFDATVCRLGAMFFPHPVAGLRKMLRVTKPDGKVALAVWDNSKSNPLFHVVTDVLNRYIHSSPDDPDSPGAFRFAQPGTVTRLLKEAGAANVSERILEFHITAPVSLDEFWTVRSELSDTVRQKLAQIDKSLHTRARQEVLEAARCFFPDGKMNFPAKAIIGSGVKV
jgi:ubiquinone/menaquinone biosynthesis C-methylase UbiE